MNSREKIVLGLAIVALLLMFFDARSEGLTAPTTTTAPRCSSTKCKYALKEFAATMKLPKAPGSVYKVLLPEETCAKSCNMSFKVGGVSGQHAHALRKPDGSVRLLAYNLNRDKQFNKTECTTYPDCVGAWGRMLGVYHEKAAPAVTPGAAPELKADSMARQFTEIPIPGKRNGVKGTLDLYLVKSVILERGIEKSKVSDADKPKYIADIIAVRPRKGSAIAKRFDWADVDRVYLVQSNRSAPDAQSLARWTAARKAAGRSTAPEDFSRYMIHTELFQLMQMQAFLTNAGELLLQVLPKVSKLPPASLTRLTAALQTVASKPGGVAVVHQGPNPVGWMGSASSFGMAVRLTCDKKLADDANSTSLHGGCNADSAKPLVATLLHEYTHMLAMVSKDEFVTSHNYGFWAMFRFVQLALVEAGLLNHNWRLNAKNYDAKHYGGFDPYFQRDWAAIKREVVRVGRADNLGGANPTTGTNWDDLWAGVEGELADKTIMARLQELASP